MSINIGKTPESQRKAVQKYRTKLVQMNVDVLPEEKELFQAAAKKCDLSLKQFILQAINEKIERDKIQ